MLVKFNMLSKLTKFTYSELFQICGFYHHPSKKWLKVQVDSVKDVSGVDIAALWCIDYGVSICTENFRRFAPISQLYQNNPGHVLTGCLNLLPAATNFDFEKCKTVIGDWSDEAIEAVVGFVRHASELRFIVTETRDEIVFGDIEGTSAEGEKYSLSKTLKDNRLAIAPKGSTYEALKATNLLKVDRWCNNFGVDGDNFMLNLPVELPIGLPEIPEESAPGSNFAELWRSLIGSEKHSGTSSDGSFSTAFRPLSIVSETSISTPMPISPVSTVSVPSTLTSIYSEESAIRHKDGRIEQLATETPKKINCKPAKSTRKSSPNHNPAPLKKAQTRSLKPSVIVSADNELPLKPAPQQKTGSQKSKSSDSPVTDIEFSSGCELSQHLNRAFNTEIKLVTSDDVAHVFIHEKYPHIPLKSTREAKFHQTIHEKLHKENFRTIFRTQSHSWPLVLEGTSTFIINSDKSGKTCSYLPAILSSILFNNDGKAPIAQGPVGIIIVHSSREVEILYQHCRRLVHRDNMSIVKAFGKWNCENKQIELLNGCDLLITTPPCFSRLAQGDIIRMFDKGRIKHLVIDGLDKISELFDKEMKHIMKTCTRGDKHPEDNPQLVITSSSWNEHIRHYMKLCCSPAVIIGSFVEAAVYAKCQFNITKNSYEEKLERIHEWLKSKEYKSTRTTIAFNCQGEIQYVSRILLERGIKVITVDINVKPTESEEIQKKWLSEQDGKLSVLLITDEALSKCRIKCAEKLIHFSLPENWTNFSRRFTTLTDAFLASVKGDKSKRPSTMILLDDQNFMEIPHLIEFVKARKIMNDIPEEINDLIRVRFSFENFYRIKF